ncbi:hypothetical protein M404DRAFT_994077, partial [Pisolithus tinctorius Marx 270]
PREARTAVKWERGATSAGIGLDGPRFHLHSKTFYLQLFYSRETGYSQRTTIVIQRTTTMVTLTVDQRPGKIGCTTRWKRAGTCDGDRLTSERSRHKER